MKKILLILAIAIAAISAKAQNVVYLFGMNANGQPVINYVAIPGVVNSGSYLDLANLPALHTSAIFSGVTRPVNSTTYTISTTYDSEVSYNISISCTATIGGTSTGSVALQYSTNAGSTWTTVQTLANSNTVTLAIALQSVTIQQADLVGFIPANALVRMVSTTAGTTMITYNTGQERY